MQILITTIPHNLQRYNTVGDWLFDQHRNLRITVSDMGNGDYECLVGVHELVEALLCAKAGITTKKVDEFDMRWVGVGEPGDDPHAPYFFQHQIATVFEEILAEALNIDWSRYDEEVNRLTRSYAPPPSSQGQCGPHKPTTIELRDVFRSDDAKT